MAISILYRFDLAKRQIRNSTELIIRKSTDENEEENLEDENEEEGEHDDEEIKYGKKLNSF